MISWHYPRTELAEQFLDTFDLGSATTLTLFAPRRMGKTEFLLNDLIPLALERGYLPVYVSFWKFERDPVACLYDGIEQALLQGGWKARLQRTLARAPDIEAGVDGVGHLRIGQKLPPVDQDVLERLQKAFDRLFNGKRPVLLCLDEVQHLASRSEFESLVYFLRTLIDTRKKTLKVIFTGSSRDGLQKLFTRRKAPLFNSSSQIDLPELGSPFVAHIGQAFTLATGRVLGCEEAMEAFRLLNKVPFSFRIAVDSLMRSGGTDILTHARGLLSEDGPRSEYEALWESLKPIEQAVLRRLAVNGRGIYQDDSRQHVADELGLDDPVPVHAIQGAINKMRGDIIAPARHGLWDFEDAGFKRWVTET